MLETQEHVTTAVIEYPRKGEVVDSPEYTFRVAAPVDARSVEISIDGSGFEPCRAVEGRWWFDWSGYRAGCHTARVRVTLNDGYLFTLPPLEVQTTVGGVNQPTELMAPQFSVLVPNEPGVFAQLIGVLVREGVDLQGIVTERIGEGSAVRFLTARDEGLRGKLETAGFPVIENEVFHLEIPNQLSALNKLARSLATEGINILSLYSIGHGDKARCIVSVDDPKRASKVIEKAGFAVVEA